MTSFWCAIAAVLLAGCASSAPPPDALYNRLGGMAAIAALAGAFADRVASDKRIGDLKDLDIESFKRAMERHFCSVSRGPCYSIGRNLEFFFQERGIEDERFSVVLEHLSATLRDARIGEAERIEMETALLSECGRKKRRGC
ncbi:MAG TPA: hypothetical protein VG873_17540 [Burkholderiales bacterium]|nr:hypothetical protein [Burkholderiales bacterium]